MFNFIVSISDAVETSFLSSHVVYSRSEHVVEHCGERRQDEKAR